ncbi:MAG: CPBP family intramembrane glutamic endopeptidase [Sphingomonas bacterium]
MVIGAVLLVSTIGILALAGDYRITGAGEATLLISPFAEMTLVVAIEEILFRGILFRIIERSLGSWLALLLSSALFAAAHLPNAEISTLALLLTVVAGLVLAAAYMATRRLWLAIGIHFSWNFASDAVFSLPTSGHPAVGIVKGTISGPTWLTGGAYGVEGSAISLGLFAALGIGLLTLAVKRKHLSSAFWS